MKVQVDLSELNINGKWYSFGELSNGINRVFKYIKVFRNGVPTWNQKELFVYVHNGVIIKNAVDLRSDMCIRKFNIIKQAKGDYSKMTFEAKFDLEII